MYINLTTGSKVHVVGPFDSVEEFLLWAEDENYRGQYRIISPEEDERDVESVVRFLQTS